MSLLRADTAEARRPRNPKRSRRIVPLAVMLVLVALAGAALLAPSVRHQLAISFVRQPAAYTELYFGRGIPVTVTDTGGKVQLSVAFVVANHEAQHERYPVLVRVFDAGGADLAERTTEVRVSREASTGAGATLELPRSSRWAVVSVELVGRSESIHFRSVGSGGAP